MKPILLFLLLCLPGSSLAADLPPVILVLGDSLSAAYGIETERVCGPGPTGSGWST
jgi:hypothetical protein